MGSERPHAWLTHQPPEPQVGQAVHFNVGWFEPGGLAVAELPDVEVRRNGELFVRLHVSPGGGGPSSESWTPAQAGSYEVTTTLPVVDGSPVRLSKTVEVRPAAGGPARD